MNPTWTTLLPALTFVGTLIAAGSGWLALSRAPAQTLDEDEDAPLSATPVMSDAERRVSDVVTSLAGPSEAIERDALRLELLRAGWRQSSDLSYYLGARVALAFTGPILGYLLARPRGAFGLASTLLDRVDAADRGAPQGPVDRLPQRARHAGELPGGWAGSRRGAAAPEPRAGAHRARAGR